MDLHQSPKHFDFAIEKLNIRQYHSTCVFLMLNYKFLLHVLWMHNMTCIYNYAFLSPGILNFSYSSSCAKRISELKYFHQNFYITFEVWMVFDVVCIYKFLSAIFEYTICLSQPTIHANKTRCDLYYQDKVTMREESYKGLIQINWSSPFAQPNIFI